MNLVFVARLATDAALFVFLISSCLIRRPRHDPKAIPFEMLFGSLLSYIISINMVELRIWGFDTIAQQVVERICMYLPRFLIANVLYRLVYAYNAQHRDRRIKPLLLSKAHGGILLILFGISFTWTIMSTAYMSIPRYASTIHHIRSASEILFLISSIEVMIEIFIIIWRPKGLRQTSKGMISFILGSFFFFFLNLSSLIGFQMYLWFSYGGGIGRVPPSAYYQFLPIATAISVTGLYTGIIHCCMQWHKPKTHGLRRPVTEDETTHLLIVSEEDPH